MKENHESRQLTTSDKEMVAPEKTAGVARALLEKYGEAIRLSEADPQDTEARFGPEKAIRNYLTKVPEEVLSKYWGHGITKGDTLDQLTALINICENSIVIGDSAELARGGTSYRAYTAGSALICSEPGEQLFLREQDRKTGSVNLRGADRGYSEVKIGLVILGVKWYPIHEELQNMFPGITFIKANQIPEYFTGK
jgi:hypothetical protein